MTVTSEATRAVVTGLANGPPYSFSVVATNRVGPGTGASASATTPREPSVPSDVKVEWTGEGMARVSWTAPASDGGRPVTGYRVTASPGDVSASASGATNAALTGLTAGQCYTFAVVALNAVRKGPPSPGAPG